MKQKKIVADYELVRNVVYHDDQVRDVKLSKPHSHVCAFENFETVFCYFLKVFFFSVQQLIDAAHFIPEVAAHDNNGQATVDQQLVKLGVVELPWHPQQLTARVECRYSTFFGILRNTVDAIRSEAARLRLRCLLLLHGFSRTRVRAL